MLLTGTLESELGLPEATLCYLSLPSRNSHLGVPPWSCRGSLSSMYIHGNGPGLPGGSSRFSHKAGAPASLPAGLCKKGNPLWLLRKGCALLLLTWPVRGLHPSEWLSNYNSYNLLELGIKGCLEMGSSLQNINTLLVILILSIWFTDSNLITYVS